MLFGTPADHPDVRQKATPRHWKAAKKPIRAGAVLKMIAKAGRLNPAGFWSREAPAFLAAGAGGGPVPQAQADDGLSMDGAALS
jgi:hypothetical protein